MSYVPMSKFGYTEQMIQTRIIDNMKEKWESHEKISHRKRETNENDMIKLTTKMIYSEKKILDWETKLKQFRDTISETVNEEDITKSIVQLLCEKGFFDNFPNKDQVIESYLKIDEDYLLYNYGNAIVIDGKIHYLSDLE